MIPLNKKIKAFTLSELLITLVISTLVIALAMLILSLINKQIGGIQRNNSRASEVRLLEKALWIDFNTNNLYYDDDQQELKAISEIDTITYQLNENYVIRNLDTLEVPVFKVVHYLDGSVKKNGAIDALELHVSENSTGQTIFIYKSKDATFYMDDYGI